jgi:putative methyltransferase (TIGR04325 family)
MTAYRILPFIKQFIPPIVWNGVRNLLVPKPASLTYMGCYSSFADVVAAFPSSTGYHTENSEEIEIFEAQNRLMRFESGDLPEYGPTLSRKNFLPILLSLAPSDEVTILDVGGGMGNTFLDLKFSLPGKKFTMTVVELQTIAESSKVLFARYPEIEFVSGFPIGGRMTFDVVYFGSSLQYFENYVAILEQVSSLAPDMIVIADTTIGSAPTFACAQVNMIGRVIPRIVFNKEELIKILLRLGYRLTHQSVNYSREHVFDNYDEPARSTVHWNLLFQRDT